MTLSIENGGYAFFNKIGFNVFYVIIKRVLIIKSFTRPIYQTFD